MLPKVFVLLHFLLPSPFIPAHQPTNIYTVYKPLCIGQVFWPTDNIFLLLRKYKTGIFTINMEDQWVIKGVARIPLNSMDFSVFF